MRRFIMTPSIKKKLSLVLIFVIGCFILFSYTHSSTFQDPLPSWQGPIKQRLFTFVKEVTTASNPHYVKPEERIAVFDNDGTLWIEQPLYTQFVFTLDRVKQLADQHPEWKTQEPFKTVLSGNKKAIAELPMHDFIKILNVTDSQLSVSDFQSIAKIWLNTKKHPHFNRTYPELIYQPMLEVMQYLRQNGFKIYIVTGASQDFVRSFAKETYGVPPENVIGSINKSKFIYQDKKATILKLPEIWLADDQEGKPIAINMFVGLKPIIAFGNSDGDRQMLEWTQSSPGKKMMLLVHHDDANCEYAYGAKSKIGTFSTSLLKEAKANDWQIISMQKDWLRIFPFDTEMSCRKNNMRN